MTSQLAPDTIERLYRTHHAAALHRLRRALRGDPCDAAEDALADAWIILARKPSGYIQSEATVRAWLVTVAKHIALHGAYSPRALTQLPLYENGLSDRAPTVHDQAAARIELAELIDTLLTEDTTQTHGPNGRGQRAMTPGRRQALACRLLGLTYHQAMDATGRTYSAVNRGITEGRDVLRERETTE